MRVPNGVGGFNIQKYLGAHCGTVTPFALTSPDQFPVPAPAMYPTGAYHAQVNEVIQYSAHLTDQQKVIAEYWADGPASETPPGHWNVFAHCVSNRDNHVLAEDVKMYFALSNALLDASIAAWDAKRSYNYVRPVTAIQYLFNGKKILAWAGPGLGARVIKGENCKPYQ